MAAFILLPRLGFQASLIVCAILYVCLAALTSHKQSWSVRRASGITIVSLGVCFVLILCFFPYQRAQIHFANARRPYEADGSVLLKKIEGTADTFQLLRRDVYGQPYYYRLVTNSYSMSGTLPRSQRYMRMFAYLPLTLRPESEDALLVGYAALGRDEDVARRDVGRLRRDGDPRRLQVRARDVRGAVGARGRREGRGGGERHEAGEGGAATGDRACGR